MRIVASNPDAMGDLVLREPLYTLAARAGHELLLLVRPQIAAVAQRVVPTARRLEIPADPYGPAAGDDPRIEALFQAVESARPELILVAPWQRTWFDEALVSRFADLPLIAFDGARYPASVLAVQAEASSTRFREGIRVDEASLESAKNLLLAQALLGREVEWRRPRLTATDAEIAVARRIVEAHGASGDSLWVACVGHGERNQSRNWNLPDWAAVLEHLVTVHDFSIALVGTPEEGRANRSVVSAMGAAGKRAFVVDGRESEIEALVGVLALARGYLGRDTGPMHLAAALGKPVVAVFGGGHWGRFLPEAEVASVVSVDVPCRGCGFICHLEETHCIKRVPALAVIAAADAVLRGEVWGVNTLLLPRSPELAQRMEREAATLARERIWRLDGFAPSESSSDPTALEKVRLHIGMHYFGAGNLGDDLMLDGFLRFLEREGPACEITCCTPFPRARLARRFPSIDWRPYDMESRSRATQESDVWLGLGDTPFQTDSGEWMLEHLEGELELCRRHGRPMFLLGVGVNDRAALEREVSRSLLASAVHVWARDAQSADWLSQVAGARKVTAAADLANLSPALRARPSPSDDQIGCVGWILHFETPERFSPAVLETVIDDGRAWKHAWLVQEARALPGSEKTLFAELSARTRARLALCEPDYEAASVEGLLGAWPVPAVVVSSRYHGLLVGAWQGSALVGVERNDKLRGLVVALGCRRLAGIESSAEVAAAIHEARPVGREILETWAGLAEDACRQFFRSLGEISKPSKPARDESEIGIGITAPRTVEVRFDKPVPGGGWHACERDQRSAFRWMGSEAWIEIAVPSADELRLRCEVASVLEFSALERLVLLMNGRPLPHRVKGSAGGWELEAALPAELAGRLGMRARIDFTVPDPKRPSDLDPSSADKRPLGMALRAVRLEPGDAASS